MEGYYKDDIYFYVISYYSDIFDAPERIKPEKRVLYYSDGHRVASLGYEKWLKDEEFIDVTTNGAYRIYTPRKYPRYWQQSLRTIR